VINANTYNFHSTTALAAVRLFTPRRRRP